MKYFIAGVGILAVLLALSILSGVFVANRVQPARRELSAAVAALEREEYDAACSHAETAAKKWKAEQPKLSAILSHETLEEIALAFSDLRVYSEREYYAEFLARCKLLQMQLKHISQMDIPSYFNLL